MSEVTAPRALELRRKRVQDFTAYLIGSQGQNLEDVLNRYSLQSGLSIRKLNEYWDVISQNNRGPIYARYGVVKVRGMFKRWLK